MRRSAAAAAAAAASVAVPRAREVCAVAAAAAHGNNLFESGRPRTKPAAKRSPTVRRATPDRLSTAASHIAIAGPKKRAQPAKSTNTASTKKILANRTVGRISSLPDGRQMADGLFVVVVT